MAMEMRHCSACGLNRWHNPLGVKKTEAQAFRCTYCAHPVGTGPKRDRHMPLHERQVNKAKAALSR